MDIKSAAIFDDLTTLRPGMAADALYRLIGPKWHPSPAGFISIKGMLGIRIDTSGRIGNLYFYPGFPGRRLIEGLHVGMKVPDALATRRLGTTPVQTGGRTYYVGCTDAGAGLYAVVGKNGRIDGIRLFLPDAVYPDGKHNDGLKAVSALVPPGDDLKMLQSWASECRAFGKGPAAFIEYANWLSTQATPHDWHRAITNWNWDCGIEPVVWVMRQPTCELATAMHIFYATEPQDHMNCILLKTKATDYEQETIALIEEVRSRVSSGFYTNATIAFNGEEYFRKAVNQAAASTAILEFFAPFRKQVEGLTLVRIDGEFDRNGLPTQLRDRRFDPDLQK